MAITDIEKGPLGSEDIEFDSAGTGSSFVRKTSSDNFQQLSKLNASKLPVTATVRAKAYADGTLVSAAGDTDVDAVLTQVLDDLEDLGQPDGTFLTNTAGSLTIADNSITAAKIATGAVDTAELAADAVDGDKIGDGVIESEHYADGSIDNEHYADNSIGINELSMDGAGGGTFSHFILDAGEENAAAATTSPITTTQTIGTSDILFAVFKNNTSGVDIDQVVRTGANQITVTTNGVASTSDIIYWMVIKATVAIP